MERKHIYIPPDSHEDHIQKMVIYLAIGCSFVFFLVVVFIYYADFFAKKIPFSAEQRFVKPYEKLITELFSDPATDSEKKIEEYLNGLVKEVSSEMNLPKDYTVKVHYLDNSTPNAFVTLGGHMFIFRGLLESVSSENSLAMIIAHELSHIKSRDPLAAMGRGYAVLLVYSFVMGDYSSGFGLDIDGSEIGLLFFSREQELAADMAAINALNAMYGHVEGYSEFFQYILDIEEDNLEPDSKVAFEEWLSTHPSLERRITILTDYANENAFDLIGNLEPLPKWLNNTISENKRDKRIKSIEAEHNE